MSSFQWNDVYCGFRKISVSSINVEFFSWCIVVVCHTSWGQYVHIVLLQNDILYIVGIREHMKKKMCFEHKWFIKLETFGTLSTDV